MPVSPAAVRPIRTKPAWLMLEYASIRLMSVWAIARIAPPTIDSADSTQMTGCQSQVTGWNATLNTRMSAANAATLVAADMNPVTAVGAPWYTSGVHMWKGTAETLNANPTASSPIPVTASAIEPVRPASAFDMSARPVEPDAPYAIAIPNRKKAEENAPSRKYFIAPSIEPRRFEKPVSTYRDSERISSARNAVTRSAETANSVIPDAANSMSG